ncbi:MAG TPA: cache domain-containing protein [Patescibacteria group bacterium]|nr:cache domain-containing protein [Patescibacteria group bacterium]
MLGRLFAVVLSAIAFTLPAVAAESVTADQVKALTLKAAEVVAKDGLAKAHDLFSVEGEYKFGEIYVNVIDFEGVWKVYPPKPAGEGKSVLGVQDADGHFLVQEIVKTAKEKGEGWVEYRWQNPATNKIQPKVTYVKRVPGQDLAVYIGMYK